MGFNLAFKGLIQPFRKKRFLFLVLCNPRSRTCCFRVAHIYSAAVCDLQHDDDLQHSSVAFVAVVTSEHTLGRSPIPR